MGWWGFELFSGDSICDWQNEFIFDLGELIDKTIEKGSWYTEDGNRGYEKEDVPGMIFVYAELSQKYTRRTQNLEKYAKWCKEYTTETWTDNKKRENVVHRLGYEIETLFQKEKEGYKLNLKNNPNANIIGQVVYHLTEKSKLENIEKEGLKKQICFAGFFENREGIYVSNSILGCLKWQYHVLGHKLISDPAFVKFTILPTDEVFHDYRVDFKDDYVVTNNVTSGRLITFY